MAGPGGGPPRRSHTKSRKGCETCKRRHIRCDENFPQCRNCTKHNCRCPYMDMMGVFPAYSDRSVTPERADLLWNPQIEADIAHWQQTDEFPFPELFVCPAIFSQQFSSERLRLLYHIASVSSELGQYDANKFTIWTHQVPLFLKIGIDYIFVMHALLALAATHLAWLTKCSVTASLAYEHRGIAMTGLHETIGSFSKKNSDAVLAASLILSWQESGWRGWTQLMHGTSSVIDAMQPWKNTSQLGDFIAQQNLFLTAPPSPLPSSRNIPQKKHFDALQQAYLQLQKVEAHFGENEEAFKKAIKQLMAFIQGVQKITPNHTVAQLFEMLDTLRAWLFWQPVMFLQKNRSSPPALLVVAHYYTVVLVVEPFFSEVGAAYFGSLTLNPIQEIACHLISTNYYQNSIDKILELMKYPIEIVSSFKNRMYSTQPEVILSPFALEKTKTNLYKNCPATFSFASHDNLNFSYSHEQLMDMQSKSQIAESLSPGSSDAYLMTSSPNSQIYYHNSDSLYHLDEWKFFCSDQRDDFTLHNSNEHSSNSKFRELSFPATTT
ncbi:putative c6 zinc finger domain containing protein [Golovinomyces cichoracearum]|uniref:Putative c6 zinc finger domain containing protein n=1 Tax=Golovinomyces cichoracearum TaxID=62708 RepID=A0A420IFP4_9PEZI|nr:putative c6 zinc finger domain containing protein [Golovinomyces cichoracearum]